MQPWCGAQHSGQPSDQLLPIARARRRVPPEPEARELRRALGQRLTNYNAEGRVVAFRGSGAVALIDVEAGELGAVGECCAEQLTP